MTQINQMHFGGWGGGWVVFTLFFFNMVLVN